MDSYPIAVCDNYRIQRSNSQRGEDFRGQIASKKRYFYGLRIHILVTEQGEPVEFFLEPGACSATGALGLYNFDIPEGAFVTGDKAYNDDTLEDVMREAGIELIPLRKKNSLRPVPAYMPYFQACIRKIIETTGSLIERLLPKSIQAVTATGFEIKITLFVLACSINFLWQVATWVSQLNTHVMLSRFAAKHLYHNIRDPSVAKSMLPQGDIPVIY